MRFGIGAIAAAGLLVGCGAPDPTADVKASEAPVPTTNVAAPNVSARSALGVVKRNGVVKVGDSITQGFEIVPMPPRAFEFSQLPPRFARPYSARGWEKADEGFGMIAYNGTVVASVYQRRRATPDVLYEILARQESVTKGAKDQLVAGGKVRYWFWEAASSPLGSTHRLMVCALETADGLNITVGSGDALVLDAIGMSPSKARTDSQRVDSVMRAMPTVPADQ